MDELLGYVAQAYNLLQTHSSLFTRILPYLVTLNKYRAWAQGFLQQYILPSAAKLLSTLQTKPDLASIALLLLVLLVSFKVVNMALQSVMFWFRLAKRLALWTVLLGASAWIWARGFEGAVDDVRYLVEYWQGEYQHWSEQTNQERLRNQGSSRHATTTKGTYW